MIKQKDLEKSYRGKIITTVTPDLAYKSLTEDIGSWWVKPEGKAIVVGDMPIFRFGETYWKMNVLELIPNKRVVWECVEANHIDSNLEEFGKDAVEEWLGTFLNWDIEYNNGKTEISFTHQGLNPDLKCFNICKAGWDHYFVNKLNEYLSSLTPN